MAKKLTSSKAKEILRDGQAHGKPLTSKQKRYFGHVAGGGKAQDGGWLKKYEDGGKLTPKQFMQQYVQSPKYEQRLSSSGYDVNDEIPARLENIEKTRSYNQYGAPGSQVQARFQQEGRPFTRGGSSFLPKSNAIIVDLKQAEEKGISPDYISAHEFGHAETGVTGEYDDVTGIRKSRLNAYDNESIINRLGEKANPIFKKVPDEIKSDLSGLRYELYDKDIYDAGTEDFKLEDLQKLDNSYIKNRLLKNYSEEDLEWLMNNIASTDGKDKTLSTMAKNGGQLKKSNQLRTFTNGWVDKYL